MPDLSVRRITWRSADVARIFVMAIVFLFLWRFFWMVLPALFLALLAILIAIVLHTPARLLSRWMPFKVSYPLVVLAFLGGIVGLIVAMIPELMQQFKLLAQQLPATLEGAAEWFQRETGTVPDPEVARNLTEQAAEFIGRFVPIAFNMVGTLLGSFAIVVLAIFFGAQPQVYRTTFLSLIPETDRPRWSEAYDEVATSLRTWIIGKAITMLVIGVCVYVGLTLLGVPGALALAALAGLLEFIPNFGPTIAAVPAIIAGFAVSPMTALWVALFYFVLQQIQSAVSVPLIDRRAVNIPPAWLLIWQLMLAIGFGILALFVATPLLAVVVVAVRMLWVEPRAERETWDRRDATGARDGGDAPPPAAPPPAPASG